MHIKTAVSVLLSALVGAACVAEQDVGERHAATAPQANQTNTSVGHPRYKRTLPIPKTLPGEVVDEAGKLWQVKEIAQWSPSPPNVGPRPTSAVNYDLLSDEQIADRLRMVKFVGDLEYTEVVPDVARARLARQNNAAGKSMRGDLWDSTTGREIVPGNQNFPQFEASVPHPHHTVHTGRWQRENPFWTLPGEQSTRVVTLGYDERSFVESIGESFARKAIKIVPTQWAIPPILVADNFEANYAQGGSGTMIGPRTAMSAAHIFWDSSTGTAKGPHQWAVDTIRWRAALGSNGPWTRQLRHPLI